MRFSTRLTYGLRALVKLASLWGKGNVSLSKIAKEEKISLYYLERIFMDLKKNKIVVASKGSLGGYKLAKEPNKITLLEVLNSLEGEVSPFYCIKSDGKVYCKQKHKCRVAPILLKIQNLIKDNLAKITLEQILKNKI